MIASLSPSLRITIRPEGQDVAFLLDNGSEQIPVGSGASLEQVLGAQAEVREHLETFRGVVGGGAVPWSKVNAVFIELAKIGNLLVRTLFEGDRERVARFRNMWTDAFDKARLLNRPALVQITSPRLKDAALNSIPFELLLTHHLPAESITNLTVLGAALDSFLGFGAILARDIGGVAPGDDLIAPDGRLPIKLFQDESLKSAVAEMGFFQSRIHEFDVDGPWPCDPDDEIDAADFLAGQFVAPERRLNGAPRDPADQVQHLACHCNTFGNTTNYYIQLRSMGAEEKKIRLLDLAYFMDRAMDGKPPRPSGPLIFLNACGSASVDPRRVGSFVDFFLRNGNRGFIGAQAMIPDEFAALFCKTFYLDFVRQRMPIGEAILGTRRKLAERYRNPLGLLYMHFGRTELKLG